MQNQITLSHKDLLDAGMQRRSGITQPLPPPPAGSDQRAKISKPTGPPERIRPEASQQTERMIGTLDASSKPSSQPSISSQTSAKAVDKPTSLKHGNLDIFKAFAKAKPKKNNLDSEPSGDSGMESV